jgi:uncharacterized protein YqcC (DUF446 family)
MVTQESPAFSYNPGMPPTPASVLAQLDRIEAEMKRIGLWQAAPLEPEQYDFRAAFAGDTMSFAQWLQFIFIPNARAAARQNKFPAASHVGAKAVREFDSIPGAAELVTLLAEFDALFQ